MAEIERISLPEVIEVDKEKCVNCHACISACPVKYCNDGSSDYVKVNPNMCIACGNCLAVCTHNARIYIDDFPQFIEEIENKEKMVAIVAPSIAANFPNQYLNFNGWLKSLGIEAIFDVSFGAELTVKSYVKHLKNNPEAIIAQPCPAIVTYIELYKPELIKHLAPVDSPMLHSIKMIKKYYPKYKDYKVAVISPCIAKKREFDETGLGEFNVSYLSISNYFEKNNIKLNKYPEVDFDNPPAERAVLFSSPGGLLQTAERWDPGMREKTRKIEGMPNIYEYIDKLPEVIENKKSPLLIDCLNCEFGCNAGPLTISKDKPVDEIEYHINERKKEHQKNYSNNNTVSHEKVLEVLDKYWETNLYSRSYRNLWKNVIMKYPNKEQLKEIFERMHKYSDEDIYNCTACGYNTCEKMATAIFNGLNRPDNCHFYLSKENENSHEELSKSEKRLNNILETAHDGFIHINNDSIILEANQAMSLILKKNDLIGRSFLEFLDEENTRIVQEQLKLREQNLQSSYELNFTQSDGNKIPCLVSGSPFIDEDGKRNGSFAMISDISNLKKAEEELRKSRDQLELKVKERTAELYETVEELQTTTDIIEDYNKQLEQLSIVASEIDNAVIIMDENGNFEWVNEGFTRMFGKSLGQISNKNIINKSTPEDIRLLIENSVENKTPVSYEFVYKQNGEEKWIQTTLTPIPDEKGDIKKLIAIDSDITKIKEKEAEILRQKEEITSQRDEIEIQRDYARRQTKDIRDSIQYASKIQNAVLPPQDYLSSILPEHFILFKPRDIVSGDFYWATKIEERVIIAAADCTGHGVPGAFMSLLGISFLNEIVNAYKNRISELNANIILNLLRKNVKSALRQKYERNISKDGMDISLCIIDNSTMEMQFAGAYNTVYIIRDNKLTEIKGDRMPIGVHIKEKDTFTNHDFKLQKDDTIYLFTDGYIDQFGGDKDGKFLAKNFKDLLIDIQDMPMHSQHNHLDITIEKWMGLNMQLDDMLVIGLKI
ncbi:PAS domain S-box protein [Bacteroidota bacterium]